MESRKHKTYERIDDGAWSGYDGLNQTNQDPWSNSPTTVPERHLPADEANPEFLPVAFETGHDQLYDSQKQTRDLLRKQLFRWLGTAFFAALIAITLKVYTTKGVITSTQKATFNAVTTALSLGLGLNFFEAFKGLARLLRWRFLAERHYSVREVDLILGLDNLINVVKLGWESSRNLGLFLFCVTWILLNLTAQISVALVNLSYSLDDGTDWNGTYTTPGTVNVSELSCYHHIGGCPGADHEDVTQSLAHSYGELATDADCGPYNTIADILKSKNHYSYYCRRSPGQQEFAHRFSEYSPRDTQGTFPYFTNRIITASSGRCFKYNYVNHTLGPDLNGMQSAWNYTFTNGSYTSNIMIPVNMESFNGTTYIYRGVLIPQEAVGWSCGPRCMWMWAHKSPGAGDHSLFYQCPITVSQVSDTTDPKHNLTDGMARLAASSIGLQGRFVTRKSGKIWTQYQFYPFGSAWEVHFHTMDYIGAKMAEFAIGSISTLANRNPNIQLQGTVPHLGSRLQVFWRYTTALLVGIAGVHFLLFVTVVFASRVVIIRDDSNLSTARLLHSVINHLGSSGTLLNGTQISQTLVPTTAGGIVYGPQYDEASQSYRLGMGADVTPRTELPNCRHPDGRYL